MRLRLHATICALALLTACSGYDEDAHRADMAEALGSPELAEEGMDEVWADIVEIGEDSCDNDEETFALAVAASADRNGEDGVAMTRVNVRHLCPERVEEFEELVAGFEY